MPRAFSVTLISGLVILLAAEALLFTDVHLSHRGPVETDSQVRQILMTPAIGLLGNLAREVAVNMTAVAWVGYLLVLEGVLTFQTGASPVRRRPYHFALLCLASIFIWCVFDFVNFHASMGAWIYIGLPPLLRDKFVPYFFAFASIVPGMLMSGQTMLNAGFFDWARVKTPRQFVGGPRRSTPRFWITVEIVSIVIGLAMFVWPLVYPNPVTNLTLWTSFVFLLDPINDYFGRPSMFRDWRNGWYGRTLAAFAGGLTCGFLWEFWNYWALTKWVYHLPFLGTWGRLHYFEMPLPGLLGFVPFGLECWVMWQTMRLCLDGLAEPLPTDRDLL